MWNISEFHNQIQWKHSEGTVETFSSLFISLSGFNEPMFTEHYFCIANLHSSNCIVLINMSCSLLACCTVPAWLLQAACISNSAPGLYGCDAPQPAIEMTSPTTGKLLKETSATPPPSPMWHQRPLLLFLEKSWTTKCCGEMWPWSYRFSLKGNMSSFQILWPPA